MENEKKQEELETETKDTGEVADTKAPEAKGSETKQPEYEKTQQQLDQERANLRRASRTSNNSKDAWTNAKAS